MICYRQINEELYMIMVSDGSNLCPDTCVLNSDNSAHCRTFIAGARQHQMLSCHLFLYIHASVHVMCCFPTLQLYALETLCLFLVFWTGMKQVLLLNNEMNLFICLPCSVFTVKFKKALAL